MFSRGSVATCLRCGGIVNVFVANLLLNLPWKNFENWSTFGEVMDKIIAARFFLLTLQFAYKLYRVEMILRTHASIALPPTRSANEIQRLIYCDERCRWLRRASPSKTFTGAWAYTLFRRTDRRWGRACEMSWADDVDEPGDICFWNW